MRGRDTKQASMLCLVSPESVVPSDHPLRAIKRMVETVLRELSPVFDVVPYPGRKQHVCAPGPGFSAECDPQVAFASHAAFGLAEEQAEAIRDDVVAAVRRLPEFFDRRDVSKADQELLRGLGQQ